MPPEVRLVATCFNQGKAIREAVHSVRGQTLPASSIIVVDDVSGDAMTLRALGELCGPAAALMRSPRLGDRGMAAVVGIATTR